MPLILEILNPKTKEWKIAGMLAPGASPASISDNKPDGKRDIYLLECTNDDSESIIYKSEFGVDASVSENRERAVLTDLSQLRILKVLKRGDEPFGISVKTDVSSEMRQLRLSHR